MGIEEPKRKKINPVYGNLALIFLKDPGLLCLVGHVNAGFRTSLVPEIKISSNIWSENHWENQTTPERTLVKKGREPKQSPEIKRMLTRQKGMLKMNNLEGRRIEAGQVPENEGSEIKDHGIINAVIYFREIKRWELKAVWWQEHSITLFSYTIAKLLDILYTLHQLLRVFNLSWIC